MASDSDMQLLSELTDKLANNIITLQISKGLKASGASAEGIRKKLEDNISQIIDGLGYFEFQEFGRADGKAPPFLKLYEWVGFQKYGIKFKDDKQRRGIAWAIQKKIAKKGTFTHITGKNTGVLVDALNQQEIQEFKHKLASKKATEIKTDISRILK